jgi:hypothetical protein
MAYKQLPISGPFGGINDAIPHPFQPLPDFDDVLNFFCRKGRVQTRPSLTSYSTPTDGKAPYIMHTFTDINGNAHTLVVTSAHAYYLDWNAGAPRWTALTMPGSVTLGTERPYGWVNMFNRVYFSNGAATVIYADGSSLAKLAGDVQGSARFMAPAVNHLVLAYTTESSVDHPNRVRWSKSGDTNTWTSVSAGSNDLIEVPYAITGLAGLGRNVYVYRANGVSGMYPTGNGQAPFAFENVSTAPRGCGNFWPYALATFGTMCCFVAEDDIYKQDGSGFSPIGGKAKKKIFADLAGVPTSGAIGSISGTPTAAGTLYTVGDILAVTTGGSGGTVQVLSVNSSTGAVLSIILLTGGSGYTAGAGKATSGGTGSACTINITALTTGLVQGFIIPSLGVGFDFLSYWLSISGSTNVTWIYNFDENSWVRFQSSAGALSCINTVYTR